MHPIKYFFIATAITLFSMWQSAEAAAITSLSITLKNGKTVVLDLTAAGAGDNRRLPVMTFSPTSVKIVLPPKPASEGSQAIPESTYVFEVNDLATMEISDSATTGIEGINSPTEDLNVAYRDGDIVCISGNTNLNVRDIMLYDLSGRRQNVVINDEGDCVTVSLSSLNSGTYILHTGVTSIKIAKK